MSSTTGTLAGVGAGQTFTNDAQAEVTWSITGQFIGAVVIERAFGDGFAWVRVANQPTITGPTSGTFPGDTNAQYRFRCTAYTLGSIAYAITSTSAIIAPPAIPTPFTRATALGPLVADGSTFSGFLTVTTGVDKTHPVTLFQAKGGTCTIAGNVLTVGGNVVGLFVPGMVLGGGAGGGFQDVARPATILTQLTGTTGVAGTYQLTDNAPIISVGQIIYGTAQPFTVSSAGWSIQLPTGTASAIVNSTITSVVDPCAVIINNSCVVQYGSAPVWEIPMGTDNSAALATIHASAYAASYRSIWFDPGAVYFASATQGLGNVHFVSDGSAKLVGSYHKRIIPFRAQRPGSVPRGTFVGNMPALTAAASPVVVVVGDSITQSPPADNFDQTGYITAKLEQKMRAEYAGRKTFTWNGYGIGGTSWRNLASTVAQGVTNTTFSPVIGSNTCQVASATNITAGQPITAVSYVPAGTLVASITGTTLVMTQNATASGSGVAVAFGNSSLPTWYNPTSNTWWSFVVAAAPDVLIMAFGMNSNNAADDITSIYTVLKNASALSKKPDIILITPYLPSNTNPATYSQANQEMRRAHAGILRGIAQRGGQYGLNINMIDQNTWFKQARDGYSDHDTYLTQPTVPSVGFNYGVVGHFAAFTPWVDTNWTTDWFVNLQLTQAQTALITTTVPLLFGIGSNTTNNLEVYRTAGGNFAVRVRLMDFAATSLTSTNTSTAFTVVSGTGIAIGQHIVSTQFPAGTTVASGSGTSWVASAAATATGADAAATFSWTPVPLFDTGVAIPGGAGPNYIRFTVRGNWLQIDYQSAIGGTGTTTRLYGGYLERFGGLMAPRLSLGAGQNIFFYEYALGTITPRTPAITDEMAFGSRYVTLTGETEPWGGNTVNHMATPGQALVYDMMLANESFS